MSMNLTKLLSGSQTSPLIVRNLRTIHQKWLTEDFPRGTTFKMVSVDPGTKQAGVAVWEVRIASNQSSVSLMPNSTASVTCRTGAVKNDWMKRAEWIAHRIYDTIVEEMPLYVVCEEPTSMALVGRTSNSLGKLLYQVGYLKGLLMADPCYGYEAREWHWLATNKWKGQLPQHVVSKRVNKLMGLKLNEGEKYRGQQQDIAHAIGIGIWGTHLLVGSGEFSAYFGSRGGINQ